MQKSISPFDLGGVFTFTKTSDSLPPELQDIYDKFTQCPEAELKLTKPLEYYGPVITDYTNKRTRKYNTNTNWITHPLTVKFYHYKNPDLDIFDLALNHGLSDLCQTTYKGRFNIIKNNVSILYKLSILIDLKIDPYIILQSVLYHEDYCNEVIEFLHHMQINESNREYMTPFKDTTTMIFIVCQYGHLDALKRLIKPTDDFWNKQDLFTNACRNGHLNIIKHLISLNLASPKQLEHTFKCAVGHGHLKIVKYLVSKGVDIKIDNDYAFRRSITHRQFHVFNYILKKDPTILERADYAMILAIHNENIPVIKLLIKSNYKHIHKINILASITIQGCIRMLKLILDHKIITLTPDDILHSVSVAIQHNHFDLMKLYIDMHPYMSQYQYSHIVLAIQYNNIKITKYLLSINQYSEPDLIQLIKICRSRKIRQMLKVQLNTKK